MQGCRYLVDTKAKKASAGFLPYFHNGLSTLALGLAFDSLGSKGKGKAGAQ